MRAELSGDLLELVVDALAGDKPTLFACMLASSVLRRRARHHLFRGVSILSLSRATAFAGLLDADPTLGADVIRRLRLRDNAWLGASGLCALLPRFPNLETLTLWNIDLVTLERERGVGALPAVLPKSIRHLALFTCKFASDAGLVALISAGLDLKSLSVELCDWSPLATAPEYESTSYAARIALKYFRLVSPSRETEVGRPWLSVLSAHQLVALELTLYGAKDVLFWQPRIDQAGSVMRKLVLMDYNLSAAGLVLSPLIVLRTLVIVSGHLPRGHGSRREPDLWIPLLCMLETVSSPSLERVVIMPDRPTPAFAFSIDWRNLRAACEAVRVRLPHLRVVLGLQYPAPFLSVRWDTLLLECENILGEAIVANGVEEMVYAERMRKGQWDK